MVTDPNFGKKQFPSKGGLDGSDNIPFKLRFQAVPYSIFSETRDEAPEGSNSFADIVLPLTKSLARANSISYGMGETETGHMFDLTAGGVAEFFKSGFGFLTAAKDLLGVGSLLGQRPMDMRDSIFQGANFRNHSFSWKLVPKTQGDAEDIAGICNAFQVCSYPMMAGIESASRVIHPPVWHINAMGVGDTEQSWTFKILPSVLTDVTIDTTPEGNYGHQSGSTNFQNYYPAVTTLQLKFQELEPAIAAGNELKSRSQIK